MKFCTSLAALMILAAGISTAQAQTTKYWDVNGTDPGATNPPGIADGTWNTSTANWNLSADGTGTPTTWSPNDNAVFSAGNDVGSIGGLVDGAFVTIDGTQTASSVLIEEGYVAFRGGIIDAPTITVNAGATWDINSILRTSTNVTKVTLAGGHFKQSNPGFAGSFLRATTELEIDGTGIISYDDGADPGEGIVSIFFGVITGAGGTPTNGGSGTLIVRGPDRISIGNTQIGSQWSQELFSFSKLVLEGGMYQPRHQNADVSVGVFETVLGAVPLVETPDAVTFNGGFLASNASFTTHPNRGFTVGPNGGGWSGIGAAVMTITGPFSGSGTFHMQTGGGGVRLQNPNNVNTFTGGLQIDSTTLFLDESLSPSSVNGTGGTINIAAGKTLSVGSGGGTYTGTITGGGGVTKTDSGTFSMDGTKTYTGDTRVLGGTLSTNSASFADAADIFLTTGAILNLNFTGTDAIDQLFIDGAAQQVGTWGAIGSGAMFTTPLITGTGLLDVMTGASVGLTGDYNNDGKVDAADYVLWRKDPASHGGDPAGYNAWRSNFGAMAPGSGSGLQPAAGAVPEPATLALLALGLAAVAAARRGR